MTPKALAEISADILDRVRERAPRVHCITNAAAQALTANVLLALGAVPSLTISPDEIAGFVARADALLVNLGTFDVNRHEAVLIGLDVAEEQRTSWVLDPVFCDASPPRAAFAHQLALREPDVVRANPAEVAALIGDLPEAAAFDRFALDNLTVLAVTGPTDLITDGAKRAAISNGHRLMSRSTAIGCAGTSLIAACLAVEDDAFLAACAGLLALGVAGEIAAGRARGPGSFVPEFIDALYVLDRTTLALRAQIAGPFEVVS